MRVRRLGPTQLPPHRCRPFPSGGWGWSGAGDAYPASPPIVRAWFLVDFASALLTGVVGRKRVETAFPNLFHVLLENELEAVSK